MPVTMKNRSLIFIFGVTKLLAAINPRVNTLLGIVEGTIGYTYRGLPYYQFEGVPFAAPPVGDLRFENPKDPQKWVGVLMAKVSTLCYQYTQLQKGIDGNYSAVGDEDCLYYNVYTPTLNQSANLNVLIHIHGGAFMFGYGSRWRPNIIMNRPVVYVSINYRLGPFGFLSTEDDILPGNLGLRDQQQALRWIKKNIKYFGGNPNSLTLHGSSAGGASVQFHYLLPESRGLFQRGIAQSGTVLNSWVLMEKPLEKTKKLASLVGCPIYDSKKIKKCLKTKSAKLIAENVRQFMPFLYNPFSPWAVVVDGYWTKKSVLPDHPLQLLRQKKIYDVPLLMSHVSSEGLYPGAEFYSNENYLQTIDTRWNELIPHILMYNNTIDHTIINFVSQAIRQKYLGNEALNRGASYFKFIQVIGDRLFVADMEKALKLHSAASNSPVWSYVFNYRGNHSASERSSGTVKNLGVSHGDDLMYILRSELAKDPTTPDDIAMSNLLVDMTMSFMNQGSPNISSQWRPVSKNVYSRPNLLQINKYNELIPLRKEHIGKRLFWDSFPFKENEKLLNVTLGF